MLVVTNSSCKSITFNNALKKMFFRFIKKMKYFLKHLN